MFKSALATVRSKTTIYSLSEVFAAVQQDIERYQHDVSRAPHWGHGYAGEPALETLRELKNQLQKWADAGVTEIETDVKFSDGEILGGIRDLITEQYREGRIRPLEI